MRLARIWILLDRRLPRPIKERQCPTLFGGKLQHRVESRIDLGFGPKGRTDAGRDAGLGATRKLICADRGGIEKVDVSDAERSSAALGCQGCGFRPAEHEVVVERGIGIRVEQALALAVDLDVDCLSASGPDRNRPSIALATAESSSWMSNTFAAIHSPMCPARAGRPMIAPIRASRALRRASRSARSLSAVSEAASTFKSVPPSGQLQVPTPQAFGNGRHTW